MNEVKCPVILGLAVGDAISWPTEYSRRSGWGNYFIEWQRETGSGSYIRIEELDKGEFSDYTLQAICTANALRYSNWLEHLVFNELPMWLVYERSADTAIKERIIQTLTDGYLWEQSNKKRKYNYYTALDRGSILRVAPFFCYEQKNIYTLMQQSFLNAIAVSGHPVVPLMACLYMNALYYFSFLNTDNSQEFFRALLDSYLGKFEEVVYLAVPAISDYIDSAKEIINFQKEWEEVIQDVNDLTILLTENSEVNYSEFARGIDNKKQIIREVFLAIYIASKCKTFGEAVKEIDHVSVFNKHFVTSIVFSLLSLKLERVNYPAYFEQIQSFNYLKAVSKPATEKGLSKLVYPNYKKIKNMVQESNIGDKISLDFLGYTEVIDKRNIAKSDKVRCDVTLCLKDKDIKNNLMYNIFLNRR